jgi:hypothetical protein
MDGYVLGLLFSEMTAGNSLPANIEAAEGRQPLVRHHGTLGEKASGFSDGDQTSRFSVNQCRIS